MTDLQFQRKLNKVIAKLHEYHAALKTVEDEYVNRYGHHPSDVDFDQWIDSLHVSGNPITVEEIKDYVTRK